MPKELILKQFDSEVKEIKGERALNVTITTNDVDRSGDIVEPKGAKLTNFKKNPVVLMAHDYSGLPIGKASDLTKTDNGITAKVTFPEEGTYPLADTVYNLYKQKFMKAWSIGFIPIKSENIVDDEDKDSKRVSYGRRFKTWELLEFSACAVPANPHALTNMVSKGIDVEPLKEAGFIEIIDEPKDDIEDKEVIHKPEETDKYIRIPVKGEEGKHKGHKIRTITVSAKEGIKGLYCIDCKKIITYIFDKAKDWTMEKAKKWMKDHGKAVSEYIDGAGKEELNNYENEEEDIDIEAAMLLKETKDDIKDGILTKIYNANEIYELVKENKELKEKLEAVELKAGAVLNAKNKSNLKNAQNLIQSVLDSAGTTEEDTGKVVDDDKNNKGDDNVIDIVTDTVDDIVVDEEKEETEKEAEFQAKMEAIINQSMDENKKYFKDNLDYVLGRVKK